MVNRGNLTASSSVIDTSLEAGYYCTLSYDTAQDLPSVDVNKSGLLLIFVINHSRRFLIWVATSGGLHLRVCWDTTWQDWKQLV